MKKLSLFFFTLLLPNTLFGFDYLLTANCNGITNVSGDVDAARLSSCLNSLINGINETRRTLDDKNNQTRDTIVRVGSTVERIQQTVNNLAINSDKRKKSENDPDQVIDSLFAKLEKEIEKHNKETESNIKQLEKRISTLEALVSKFTDEVASSKQNNK